MNKIRINELARQLEIPSHSVLEMLPELGVTEKKTHSSSVDEDVAELIRKRIEAGGVSVESRIEPSEPGVVTAEPPEKEKIQAAAPPVAGQEPVLAKSAPSPVAEAPMSAPADASPVTTPEDLSRVKPAPIRPP